LFKVNDQLQLAVYINGKELMLTNGNMMQSLWMRAGALLKLPLMVLRYVDLCDATSKVGLQDNVPVTVSFDGIVNVERRFRVHSWTRVPVGEGYSYTINCVWDAPKYWVTTTNSNIRGTSYEVIKQIAHTCKLEFHGKNSQTADSMLWAGGNRTYNEYVRDIARHGYVDEKSQMVLGVDTEGMLKYMNINAIPKPTLSLGHTAQSTQGPFLQILDFTPKSTAGDNNAIAGYHHDRHTQSLEGGEVHKTVTLDPDCRKPLVNKEVRAEVGRGGVSYAPIDCGANVHPKYERALYQNTRFNLLNNLRAQVLIGMQTDLDLFDNFKYVPSQQLSSDAYSGEYTISDKIIYIAGNAYYEKFTSVKNGLET
jgi:hypothetical protein